MASATRIIGIEAPFAGGELNPQQREFAETIRGSGETLLTIINDILDFSKIEAGKLTFEILDFDLVETVESTLDLLAAAAHAKKIELVSEIVHDVPAKVRGDSGRLRQILTANAMQGERENCLAIGMDDYLTKPVRTIDLQAVLEKALTGRLAC